MQHQRLAATASPKVLERTEKVKVVQLVGVEVERMRAKLGDAVVKEKRMAQWSWWDAERSGMVRRAERSQGSASNGWSWGQNQSRPAMER